MLQSPQKKSHIIFGRQRLVRTKDHPPLAVDLLPFCISFVIGVGYVGNGPLRNIGKGDPTARIIERPLLLSDQAQEHHKSLDPGGNTFQIIPGTKRNIAAPEKPHDLEGLGQRIVIRLSTGFQLIRSAAADHSGGGIH